MSIEAIISDTHNHNWSVFSHVLPSGVNSRLQHILDETWRAAETVKALGGNTLIHCGDIFHVRGSVAPSVLNPTIDLYGKIYNELGVNVYLLAGNHDLEGKNSSRLGNAGEAMIASGVWVISHTYADEKNRRLFVPYFDSCDQVRKELLDFQSGRSVADVAEWKVYLHAPLNGVLTGIPDHGFSPEELESYGFQHVFCGHYHNHREFEGVTSVGALTHQTFSDVDSAAGFITYTDDGELMHYPSNAPRFVDFDERWLDSELDMLEYVSGNYLRVKLESATNEEVEELRKLLTAEGALAVQVVQVPKITVSREGGASIAAGASIRVSVADWCKSRGFEDRVGIEAQAVLDEIEARS